MLSIQLVHLLNLRALWQSEGLPDGWKRTVANIGVSALTTIISFAANAFGARRLLAALRRASGTISTAAVRVQEQLQTSVASASAALRSSIELRKQNLNVQLVSRMFAAGSTRDSTKETSVARSSHSDSALSAHTSKRATQRCTLQHNPMLLDSVSKDHMQIAGRLPNVQSNEAAGMADSRAESSGLTCLEHSSQTTFAAAASAPESLLAMPVASAV